MKTSLSLVQKACTGLLLLMATTLAPQSMASFGYYVGKNLTADGSVLLGGTGEEPSSHWLEIVPRQQHEEGSTITVGATERARLPARLSEIPQVAETFRYITMNYSSYAGFPAPLTNGGLNEHQVAVRDIWSPSRPELVDMTPEDQTGPQYSDLARIAVERARTAREAVEIIGSLIDEYGYTTYGGNSHLIADPDEGWVVLQFAGGKGLWAAERLGPDDIRANYPGYIQEFPVDFADNPDYMGSPNLIDFAIEQGWYDPNGGEAFNIEQIYGIGAMRNDGSKYMSPRRVEETLRDMVPVSVADMMAMVRDPRISDDQDGYGQVAHLRDDLAHPELALLWVAPTGSVTAPFVPWWIGVTEVPPEFGMHRYLTEGTAPRFLNPAFQQQEATEFAGRLFKRLMYNTCAHPDAHLERVIRVLTAFEDDMLAQQSRVEQLALLAFDADPELARALLTHYSNGRAMAALELGRDLVAGIEAENRTVYGIDQPPAGTDINAGPGQETVHCLVDGDTDQLPPARDE